MKHITLLQYPNVREDRNYWEGDDFLIALYLNKAMGWRIAECMNAAHMYTIELIEGFYTLDMDQQGTLAVGRDNYIITRL